MELEQRHFAVVQGAVCLVLRCGLPYLISVKETCYHSLDIMQTNCNAGLTVVAK